MKCGAYIHFSLVIICLRQIPKHQAEKATKIGNIWRCQISSIHFFCSCSCFSRAGCSIYSDEFRIFFSCLLRLSFSYVHYSCLPIVVKRRHSLCKKTISMKIQFYLLSYSVGHNSNLCVCFFSCTHLCDDVLPLLCAKQKKGIDIHTFITFYDCDYENIMERH